MPSDGQVEYNMPLASLLYSDNNRVSLNCLYLGWRQSHDIKELGHITKPLPYKQRYIWLRPLGPYP